MATENQGWGARKAVPAPESRMASAPNPQETASETMNHTSSKEETMSADTEASKISPEMGSTQQPVEAKKRRNRMKDVNKKIAQMRELVVQGRTREQICEILGIDLKGFTFLRYKLNDLDKTYYDIPREKEAGRSAKSAREESIFRATDWWQWVRSISLKRALL